MPERSGRQISIVIPAYNEERIITRALRTLVTQTAADGSALSRHRYEVVVVDNGSTDGTAAAVRSFAASCSGFQLRLIREDEKGVAPATRAGMQDAVERSRAEQPDDRPYYLLTTHADCLVERDWCAQLVQRLAETGAAMSISSCYYDSAHFTSRPRLWKLIERSCRARDYINGLLGGFPESKGYAVTRRAYTACGGIKLFYQLWQGRFIPHCSEDWDFACELRAMGDDIVFAPRSRVLVDARRVDLGLADMIAGCTYGVNGILNMSDLRHDSQHLQYRDPTEDELQRLRDFTNKDFVLKYLILPLFLSTHLLVEPEVRAFLGPLLAERLEARIAGLKHEKGLRHYRELHSYKTAVYRLYFEFAPQLYQRCQAVFGEEFGPLPPYPAAFSTTAELKSKATVNDFYYYYSEDRESGDVHNYFGNGGVF